MGTIDDYLAGLDDTGRATVEHLYAVAREAVPEAEQGTSYGMPALIYRGKALLSVMRAKTHVGIYPFGAGPIEAIEPLLDGIDHAKGTIRVPVDAPLPDNTLRALLAARIAQIES
ncbi:iron chaperone [Protaetiibacter larvae]|uniref:DUF1801 domain-containing protein n=1 Tax=Protaetiibacter larvae TaxID=2592654 RepID=A0A5C1YCT4_9MICO|nr:DUF1801 domain-containing protein [Protaetiibacter larvae]QEO10632.1 DUF1801 domain-containing protein [Protaetiibacter larvae]